LHGWPGYAQAVSDIEYFGFYPQMGWFVTDWLELYGEGTAHMYYRPHAAILGGVVGIGGRHYFLRDRQWTPYYTLAGGMAWTSLEVPEVDRIWNFQVVWGAGIKRITRRGPGLMLEFATTTSPTPALAAKTSASMPRWWSPAFTGCCGKAGPDSAKSFSPPHPPPLAPPPRCVNRGKPDEKPQ
jgi:hypothetical protein